MHNQSWALHEWDEQQNKGWNGLVRQERPEREGRSCRGLFAEEQKVKDKRDPGP